MSTKLPADFSRLAWANLAAQLAEQTCLAAVPLVAVLALKSGAGEIGLLAAFQTLPFLLFAIPLGLVADRMPRQRLMVLAEVLRSGSLAGLLATLLLGWTSITLLAILGFLGALGTVAFSVAAPALASTLVERKDLARANGRMELARSAAYTGGPALAGALVAWAGAPFAFVLATVLSVAALMLMLRITEPARLPPPPRHPWLELQDGTRFVWRHRLLQPILLTGVAWNLAWFVLQAAYVPYAVGKLGMTAAEVGTTLAVYGLGMVTGALLAARLVARVPFGRAIQIGPLFSVVASALMLATWWLPSGVLAAFAFFWFGLGPTVWVITSTTLRQTVTPSDLLGKVNGVFLTVSMGARPLGAALGGFVGSQWSEEACLVLSLVLFLVQFALIFYSPISQLAGLPLPEPAKSSKQSL